MKAVYFDLDGTLIDFSRCSVKTTQETFHKYCGMDIEEEKIIEKMGIPIEVSFRELSHGIINNDNWDEIADYFRTRYKENTDKYTSAYEGIPELLKELSDKQSVLSVVTSKKTIAAENNLTLLGIREYFYQVIGSDKVKHYKPHPDPVYKARQGLDITPQIEIVIGDADTDIQMGKSAGVLTCAVTWGAHDRSRLQKASPDYLVTTVDEMKQIILTCR